MITDDQAFKIARKGYEAYGESTGNKNYKGDPMPLWNQLPVAIHNAWVAATKAIVENSKWITPDIISFNDVDGLDMRLPKSYTPTDYFKQDWID